MVIKWLGRMLDRESAAHDSRRFQTRLRAAKPRESGACMEDIDYRAARRLDRALFQSLRNGASITRPGSILIIGPCGLGKSRLACARGWQTCGHEACRHGKTTL
jgi:DNA replication protein DnaC